MSWRLADLARRLDWWNIKQEHTPFEWACQHARQLVEPSGEERADLRAARNTTQIVIAQSMERLEEDVIDEVFTSLRYYLKSNAPAAIVLTPAQAAAKHR